MKVLIPLAAAALLFTAQGSAQDASRQAPPTADSFKSAPPPPGMNDPGVDAQAAPPAAQNAKHPPRGEVPAEPSPTQLPGKPIPLPRQPGETQAQTAPDIRVRQEGDNKVQEYRQGGRLTMVVITPKNGVPQTYMVNADGKLRGENGAPPVQPVMYKVLEFGKPAKTAEQQGAPTQAGDGR